jgi:hypothetical protein
MMEKGRVVHVKSGEHFDVYIGREHSGHGKGSSFKRSIWHNPFKIGRDGTREEVIEKYRQYLLSRPDLLERLPELGGKVLGCWCAPDEACHGDVLLELLRGSVLET